MAFILQIAALWFAAATGLAILVMAYALLRKRTDTALICLALGSVFIVAAMVSHIYSAGPWLS